MVDDVENILREIADRVRTEQGMSPISQSNGQSTADVGVVQRENDESPVKATLARIESNLTTTGRAWDRLPPIVSNRTGAGAGLELWIKRFFKRATRWYSWEQVNFNAAVHHALRDTLSAVSALDVELQNVRRQALAERELLSRFEADLRTVERELESRAKQLEQRHELQRQQLESRANEIAAQRSEFEALTSHVQARLSELSTELRERSDKLLDEQRVSFRQLALEISEVGTLVDRGRRDLQIRFEKVEQAASKSR